MVKLTIENLQLKIKGYEDLQKADCLDYQETMDGLFQDLDYFIQIMKELVQYKQKYGELN